MTVTAQTPARYFEPGSLGFNISYSFLCPTEADMEVIQNGSTLVLNVDYTMTGEGNPAGGVVTLTSQYGPFDKISLRRKSQLKRDTDYPDNGDLLAATLDADIDNPVLILQEINEKADRAFKTDGFTLPAITGSRTDGTALLSLINILVAYGMATDSSTA